MADQGDQAPPGPDATSDLVRYAGPLHDGPERASPYPISRLAPPHDLVDIAREIKEADAFLSVKVSAELGVIAEQIRALQEQARRALDAAKESADLHRIPCSFKRRPGHRYHLYRRDGGERYWSMLSPDDWGGRCPHVYAGTYELRPDRSFVRVGDETTGD